MGDFRFKRFTVHNERSAMKVNTDGVLLGASVSLRSGRVLDIGTGTGTIALIIAQRTDEAGLSSVITGIDIDPASAEEAGCNFAGSPWPDRLDALCCSLGDYSPDGKFDLIVSNPPYYDNSLQNPDERESAARHNISLSYREVLEFAAENLSEAGLAALVLPADTEKSLLREARSRGLFPQRILRIRTTPKKETSRIIAEFSSGRVDTKEEALTIQDGGAYTSEYISLVRDFYEKM